MSTRLDIPAGLRQCIGKKRYSRQELAIKVARRCERARGVALREYFCGICGRWHLTKQPSPLSRHP